MSRVHFPILCLLLAITIGTHPRYGAQLQAMTPRVKLFDLSQVRRPTQPGQYYYAIYPISDTLVRGKQSITVRFQSMPREIAGGIFDLRTIKASERAGPPVYRMVL